jgi:hypothetical protein
MPKRGDRVQTNLENGTLGKTLSRSSGAGVPQEPSQRT